MSTGVRLCVGLFARPFARGCRNGRLVFPIVSPGPLNVLVALLVVPLVLPNVLFNSSPVSSCIARCLVVSAQRLAQLSCQFVPLGGVARSCFNVGALLQFVS